VGRAAEKNDQAYYYIAHQNLSNGNSLQSSWTFECGLFSYLWESGLSDTSITIQLLRKYGYY
jgi:hypothetical protein